MSILVEPIGVRAVTAHDAPDVPDALEARSEDLVASAVKSLTDRLNTGVRTVQAEATQAADSLMRLATGQENAADVALAGRVLGVAATAAEKAVKLLDADAAVKIPAMLTKQVPELVHALMPGISVKDALKAMVLVSELAAQAKDPNLQRAAAVLKYLRGTPSRGTRETGRLADHFTSTILGAMMGEPFDRGRFLTGALRASSKDLKARSIALRADERTTGGTP